MSGDEPDICEECHASVFPDHVESGRAGFIGGRLLCPHCLVEANKKANADPDDEALAPIAMDADAGDSSSGSSAIHGMSRNTLTETGAFQHDVQFNRPLDPNAAGATRCRTFHAKLNEGAVAYMNEQLNSWADSDPEVTIKFATSTIGLFESKHPDPHVIITVFY